MWDCLGVYMWINFIEAILYIVALMVMVVLIDDWLNRR